MVTSTNDVTLGNFEHQARFISVLNEHIDLSYLGSSFRNVIELHRFSWPYLCDTLLEAVHAR